MEQFLSLKWLIQVIHPMKVQLWFKRRKKLYKQFRLDRKQTLGTKIINIFKLFFYLCFPHLSQGILHYCCSCSMLHYSVVFSFVGKMTMLLIVIISFSWSSPTSYQWLYSRHHTNTNLIPVRPFVCLFLLFIVQSALWCPIIAVIVIIREWIR